MLFNSFVFVAFFLVAYVGYLLLQGRLRWQNVWLLVASYVFYGWWDARFLLLIALSTVVDFWVGQRVFESKESRGRRRWLVLSMAVNLGTLGVFKYFNFFADSFAALANSVGWDVGPVTLNVILPVGISFYTFQTMSYTIDIYRGKMEPTRSLLDFGVFVAFFPQLVAGPIERAVNLLPQVQRVRRITIEQVNAGVWLLLWGYFKKTVIADNVAVIANDVFGNHTEYQGLILLLGVMAFAVQIYCDFSGYSDIARGIAKLMGFELMLNFRLPYFALNPSDFWRRWHISLSGWLRDYLYVPLGGNRMGTRRTLINLMVTMVLGGLWHGAAWNFVWWGAFHGLILVLYRMAGAGREPGMGEAWWRVALQMGLMFGLTLFGWLLFRAESMGQVGYFVTHLAGGLDEVGVAYGWKLLALASPLLVMQVVQHFSRDLLVPLRWPTAVQVPLYSCVLLAIALFGAREVSEFIYFQF